MMTDTQRRLMHARQKVSSFLVDPIQELLAATAALVDTEKKRADAAWRAGYDACRNGVELSDD